MSGARQARTATSAGRRLSLSLLRDALAVCRLPSAARVPAWAWRGCLVNVSRTRDELTIVCAESAPPRAVQAVRGWRCLRIDGVFAFGETGILAAVAAPLAEAGVGIFAFSSFDTDYVLVRAAQLRQALGALRRAGHAVKGRPRTP